MEEIKGKKGMSGLLFICSSIIDKLSSLLVKELELVGFVRDELVNLHNVLSEVQTVLENLSEALIEELIEEEDETNSIQNWLMLLEDVAYDADDLLDALVTEASILELEEEENKKRLLIKSNFSSVKTIKVKMNKIADVLNETRKKLRTKVASLFNQRKQKQEEETKEQVVVAESNVFGHGEDIKAIINRLLFKSDNDDNEVWDSIQGDMNSLVLPVLKMMSYDHLPGYLKQCFIYCSLFPKGFHFDKDELVLLWMAEGFVQPDEGKNRMEDIASSYFEELLSRSLFEVSRTDHLNDRPRFKMHDIIHELARSLAKTQFFLMEENNSLHIPKGARHSSLLCKQCGTSTFESFYSSKGLRTLLLLGVHNTHIDRLPRDLFLQLKRLRVLDLSHTSLIDVPNSIGNLLHLRYLNLSHTHVKVLPDSMSSLYNLQTLRLSNCSKLVAMPRRMRKLINLRHLQLDSVSRLFSMPEKIGMLTNLQTLTVFVVGRGSGHRIGELKELIELRGELQILKLENVASLEEAEEAMLQDKKYLHKLELRWTEFQDDGVEDILKGLQPPSSLTELQIVSYGGSQFPFWMADPKFLHLVSISLYNCIKCQVLPPLGQLPRLKYLRIDGMDGVKNIDHAFCGGDQVKGFPELEMLTFKGMTDLEEWQGVVEGDIPMLRELMIAGCSKLRQLPELIIFKDLQDLEISLCPELASLPEKGMPTTLRSLTIRDCPKLKEHLQNAGGKDRQKIEHIPTIWID